MAHWSQWEAWGCLWLPPVRECSKGEACEPVDNRDRGAVEVREGSYGSDHTPCWLVQYPVGDLCGFGQCQTDVRITTLAELLEKCL